MNELSYVLRNFFTHKDFLVPGRLPGMMYTPLHLVFLAVVLTVILASALYVGHRERLIDKVFARMWVILLIWEVAIVTWDSVAGRTVGLDLSINLSLYPCSIFLYVLPLVIWGGRTAQRIGCGYICTLGLLGALVNLLYPVAHLNDYSCISFAGMHTQLFHGCMLFAFLVLQISGRHRYTNVRHWWELLLPSLASLIMSVPANLINYSSIDADYMYFRGKFFLLAMIFGDTPEVVITLILYGLYLVVPALFYLPSYVANKLKDCEEELSVPWGADPA